MKPSCRCKQYKIRQPCTVVHCKQAQCTLGLSSRLANFNITTIHRMGQNQQRQWVKHLDTPRDAYTLNLRQRGHNQNSITRYMLSTSAILHDTLESNYGDEIANGQAESVTEPHLPGNKHTVKVVHSSLESKGKDKQAISHVRSNSVTQRDARQNWSGATPHTRTPIEACRGRRQYQILITRYMLPGGISNAKQMGPATVAYQLERFGIRLWVKNRLLSVCPKQIYNVSNILVCFITWPG